MKKTLCLFVMAWLLASCSGNPASLSKGSAAIILNPRFEEGRLSTQVLVSNYTKGSINHLVLKLFTIAGETESPVMSGAAQISRDIRGSNLDDAMVISNLVRNTTYRVRCYAYKAAGTAPGDLISKSTSYVDVSVLTDDRPTLASLPVYLRDISFAGQATIALSSGGCPDFYRIDLSLCKVVNGSENPAEYTDSLRKLVANLRSYTLDNLAANTRYRLKGSAVNTAGVIVATGSLDIQTATNDALGALTLSLAGI